MAKCNRLQFRRNTIADMPSYPCFGHTSSCSKIHIIESTVEKEQMFFRLGKKFKLGSVLESLSARD